MAFQIAVINCYAGAGRANILSFILYLHELDIVNSNMKLIVIVKNNFSSFWRIKLNTDLKCIETNPILMKISVLDIVQLWKLSASGFFLLSRFIRSTVRAKDVLR